MKVKVTKKIVNTLYKSRICVSYCALQKLLSYEKPIAYTTRKEGWGADIYSFGDTAIITGYAPFGNIQTSYDMCQKYESKAFEIIFKDCSDRKLKNKMDELIKQFIEEVTTK